MKSKYLMALFAIFTMLSASSQNVENNAYAITSEVIGSFEWTEVKLINLDNGEVINSVFDNSKSDYTVFNGRTAQPIALSNLSDSNGKHDQRPFAGLSAACAFDKKRNRLYYAPMFINQLRYIDLSAKTPHVYIFEDKTFSTAENLELEENHITRMVIAADGNGYALNNDGSHLVRFTTGETPEVADLGALRDALSNGDISVANPNTSWGGDLIADASGNLFLITAHNYVFKIDVQTKAATFIAEIKNLPEGFTTNGAVVEKNGKVVLSSANFLSSYFTVDPSSWTSEPIASSDHLYTTSDLANNNFLYETKLPEIIETPVNNAQKISLFPNPVKSNVFRISFENKEGNYSVQLIDIAGRLVSDKAISVSSSAQSIEVKVNAVLARGIYMAKVLNHENKEVFLKKIILQ